MKKFNQFITFYIKELIVSYMILNNKTEISIEEIYNFSLSLDKKMKKENIIGNILYSNVYLREFKQENSEDFYVGEKYISLKKEHSIEWLIKNYTPYMSLDKLEILGLIDLKNINSTL